MFPFTGFLDAPPPTPATLVGQNGQSAVTNTSQFVSLGGAVGDYCIIMTPRADISSPSGGAWTVVNTGKIYSGFPYGRIFAKKLVAADVGPGKSATLSFADSYHMMIFRGASSSRTFITDQGSQAAFPATQTRTAAGATASPYSAGFVAMELDIYLSSHAGRNDPIIVTPAGFVTYPLPKNSTSGEYQAQSLNYRLSPPSAVYADGSSYVYGPNSASSNTPYSYLVVLELIQ